MKIIFTVVITLSLNSLARSQDGNWDVYMASYEKGAGSTTVNMDLIERAPISEFPFIVIAGVTAKNCTTEGFPTTEEFDMLYKISDNINKTITNITKNEIAGTFTYQCERLDYIYVKDTVGLRVHLTKLFGAQYAAYKFRIKIWDDKEWEAYRTFLYPSEDILEYMSNEKIIYRLMSAGDKLEKARTVDHWLYFGSKKDRDAFIKSIKGENFKVESADFVKETDLHFQLHISCTSHVDIESITKLTRALTAKAKKFNGDYDGWETALVKD
jgi:hypothetical protein